MRRGLAKILEIVMRDGVGVGTKGAERKSGFLRFESEGVHFNRIEKIFSTLLAGEKVINPGEKRVAAKFQGVAAGIETEGLGEVETMLAGGAGEDVGTADGVHNGWDFDESGGGVGVGLLQVTGKLSAKMADETRGKAAGEGGSGGFSGDGFFSVIGDGIVGKRTSGIEEDVVRSPVAGGVETQRELIAGRKVDIELAENGVADLGGGVFSGERGELGGGGEDKGLVTGFVVAGRVGAGSGLGNDLRTAVEELDDVRDVKEVLIEPSEKEDFIFLDRASDGASGLLLAVVRAEGEEGIGGAEGAIAEEIESGALAGN